jgi:hypothetical protein
MKFCFPRSKTHKYYETQWFTIKMQLLTNFISIARPDHQGSACVFFFSFFCSGCVLLLSYAPTNTNAPMQSCFYSNGFRNLHKRKGTYYEMTDTTCSRRCLTLESTLPRPGHFGPRVPYGWAKPTSRYHGTNER